MTTYNTGNPLPSADPRDLYDNAENLDVAVNTQNSLEWTDRLGVTRKTWKGIEIGAAEGTFTVTSLEELNAITPEAGTFPAGRVTEGLDAGYYAWSGTAWVKTVDPLAGFINLNSLTVNRGKDFPLKRMVRAGYDYGPRQGFLDAILGCVVNGADPLRYYRVALIENGSTANGGNGQGIMIERLQKSTFETTGAAVVIHSNTSANGLNLDYAAGGLQYRRIQCDLDKVVTLEIVIDVDALPPYGEPIAAIGNTFAGYNWIFDPVTYRTASILPDDKYLTSQTINQNKDYPMVRTNRAGSAVNWVHPAWREGLIDARIDGGRPGYVYRIGTYMNGSLVSGVESYGILLSRIPVARLSEAYEEVILATTDPNQLVIDHAAGGIQTASVYATQDPFTKLTLVIDVDKFYAKGSVVTSTASSQHGWNNILSQTLTNYAEWSELTEQQCYVDYDGVTKKLMVSYKSGAKWYRVQYAYKYINQTYAILGWSSANAYNTFGDLIPMEFAQWTRVAEGDSDYLSPMVVAAVNNGDPGTSEIYTSGGHGTINAEGDPTAQSMMTEIYVDNARIDMTKSIQIKCLSVRVMTANRFQGWNTVVTKRWIGEEYFTMDITAKGVFVHKTCKALEDLTFSADNGLQVYTPGFSPLTSTSYLFWGGSQTARENFPSTGTRTSGPKSSYPKAYGITLRHSASGDMAAWIDVNYGVGTRAVFPPNMPLLDWPGSAKIYQRMFNGATPFSLAAGETYEWRGGFYWGMPTNSGDFDTVVNTQAGAIYVKNDGTYTIS